MKKKLTIFRQPESYLFNLISFDIRTTLREKNIFLSCDDLWKLSPSIWRSSLLQLGRKQRFERRIFGRKRRGQNSVTPMNSPRAWSTFSHYGEKLRGTMATNFLARFRFPVSRRETIFIFASNDWNCHKAVRTNRRDGRRKGCTSNSRAMKFIAATWPGVIIRRNNSLLPKQSQKILNLLSDYWRHAVIVRIKWKGESHTV